MSNNNKWYHVKVLCLQHRISASVITNALVIAFVDGFNKGLQLHNKLSWEYILFGTRVKTFLLPQRGTISYY